MIFSREISLMMASWLRDKWLREKNVPSWDDDDDDDDVDDGVGSLREPKSSSVWEGEERALQRLVMGGGGQGMRGFWGRGGIDVIDVSSTLALRVLLVGWVCFVRVVLLLEFGDELPLGVGSCLKESRDLLHMLCAFSRRFWE
jgi:hypothetical protein